MNLVNLKAEAYDILVALENLQIRLKQVNQMISEETLKNQSALDGEPTP